MELWIHIVIAIFGASGFALANHILNEKQKPEPMVCPLEFSCDEVVKSQYSVIMGVRLEVAGMAYYALIAISYALFVLFPYIKSPFGASVLLIMSAIGFVASLILTMLQALVIKHYCTWCLFSAGFCTIIFVLSFIVL